jgi:response regulator RpfG family c-di-GMP phosphodiesterase
VRGLHGGALLGYSHGKRKVNSNHHSQHAKCSEKIERRTRKWKETNFVMFGGVVSYIFKSINSNRLATRVAMVKVKEMEKGRFEVIEAKEMLAEAMSLDDQDRRMLALSQATQKEKEKNEVVVVVQLQARKFL